MTESVYQCWAKSQRRRITSDELNIWHPLVLHLLDVAACADAILEREPESTRLRFAALLGLEWKAARPWLLLLVACHDLGKGCPGFQCKWKNLSDLDNGASPDTTINHAFVSQIEVSTLLQENNWPQDLAELAADAIGCHHGERASSTILDDLEGNRRALGNRQWKEARKSIFDAVLQVFAPTQVPTRCTLTGPDFMLLAGLTSFADWIGSNETYFPFGALEDCNDLTLWFQSRLHYSETALNEIGWSKREPLATTSLTFEQVFGFAPRPLQQAVAEALAKLEQPAILLVEAPMGEGKTEAAFYAHLELQRRFQHRGLYMALPTKATGNAMFRRTLKFLNSQKRDRILDLQLLHGGALLNDDYQKLKFGGIHDAASGGEIRASEWFTHKKRALLSEYGVGTIDQALLTILPVRHQFVRLWGLSNRVVVFDEVHAYDAYTGTLLLHLVRWLQALGSTVVLLSATLPPKIRRRLAEITSSSLPDQEAAYPRITVFGGGKGIQQTSFQADASRRLTIALEAIDAEIAVIKSVLDEKLKNNGYALSLLNTVQRAQQLYGCYGDGEVLLVDKQGIGKRLEDGTEVYLFHARFPADKRQQREDAVLKIFGPPDAKNPEPRSGKKILIATQVAEQSLDLDFDVMATDLAPIDLLLQRAGRLWRHKRDSRPLEKSMLIVAGLAGSEPCSFGEPLWWSKVYREDVLLRTWKLLHEKQNLCLPDEIDDLVKAVYEEEVEPGESWMERMQRALNEGEGQDFAYVAGANQAIIGLPDDASWKTGARFTLYDDDEPGVHATLRAKTRLGDDSVIAIPLWESDVFDADVEPDFMQAKQWFLRAMSLSRKSLVRKLRDKGVPESWKKSALLRNAYPLHLDANSCWREDASIQLTDALGLVYHDKQTSKNC